MHAPVFSTGIAHPHKSPIPSTPSCIQARAMHSISTGTPFGSWYTATQLLAGLCVKNFSYVAFISAKLSMLVKKTLTLTTFEISDPASLSTAERFLMQSSVIFVMVEDSRVRIVPDGSQGIWPEQ